MNLKKVGVILAVAIVLIWIFGRFTSSPSPNRTSSVAASPAAQAPANKWHVTEDRSPMDDSKTVVLSLDSDDVIEGPLGPSTPSLIVRCKEAKTQVYIHTGMAASVEEDLDGGPSDVHTVKIRLDQGDAVTEHWGESTAHEALFSSRDGIEFAKQLAEAQTLTFQFTPFDANPAIARFNLRGLDTHLRKVAEACGWSMN